MTSPMFRVVRTAQPAEGGEYVHIVWTGDDRADYTGGLGCFDADDEIVVRVMQRRVGDEWVNEPSGYTFREA